MGLVIRCAVRTSKGIRLDENNVQVSNPIGEGSFGRCFRVSFGCGCDLAVPRVSGVCILQTYLFGCGFFTERIRKAV